MAGLKLQKFTGKAPRIAPELLPDTAAQTATNVKLYSGDLLPYPKPVVIGNHGLVGIEPKTLYALRNPEGGTPTWLAWSSDVDITTPAGSESTDEQRFYYTGDGVPKVSTYDLATSAPASGPADYYELGLPLPELQAVATDTPFDTRAVSTFARDAAGVVTLTAGGDLQAISAITQADPAAVTCAEHGFTTGDGVIISGVEGMSELNGNRYIVTVTGGDTFTLDATDSTAYNAYVSGGSAASTAGEHGLKDGAFVTVTGFASREGTYSQTDNTITVTLDGHGLSTGAQVFLRVISGTAATNNYTVSATPDFNTFEVRSTVALTTSGDIELDLRSFNATSVEITAVNATTLTYFSPGFQIAQTETSDAKFDLAGATQARTYVYTWYTPWEEESIGSDPSGAVYVKEGQLVTISNLPSAPPDGKNFVRGIRLYRTVSTTSDSGFLRVATLWFPVPVLAVDGQAVTTSEPHNLSVGQRFKISGGVTDAEVEEIEDPYTFTFTGGTGSGGSGGVLYHDIAEDPDDEPARYWADPSYDLVDDYSLAGLGNVLDTDDYDAPPEGLRGLSLFNNNIMVGFVGNEVFFSEPGKYHAWPDTYKKSIPHTIVGVAALSGNLLVLTESYPYILSGNDPAILSLARIDANYPCLNKSSISTMNYGLVYATHDGLVVYSATAGPQLMTRELYSSDAWNEDLDPDTVVAAASYKDTYLAWHAAGGLSFERSGQAGTFVDLVADNQPTAIWYDSLTNKLYYTTGTAGDIYEWDNPAQRNQSFTWRSKVFQLDSPLNLGAAQVIAAYETPSTVWGETSTKWGETAARWDTSGGVTFRLYTEGTLVMEHVLASDDMFRLPVGYKSDTFEVEIEASVRVKTVRLAETPLGLRKV